MTLGRIVSLALAVLIAAACGPGQAFFQQGDHVVIIGNGLADRMQHHGWLEAYLQSQPPELELVIRNQGFTGDRIERLDAGSNKHNSALLLVRGIDQIRQQAAGNRANDSDALSFVEIG